MSVSELQWAGSQAGGPAAHGKTAYLPYIDGLRAWAVLSVMLITSMRAGCPAGLPASIFSS
ncbi:putative acyltransferase domain protein [Burkholderia pseudomallei NCTC 13178]|nr:putative acyltransferase domain protein [Burkholderia pseudomallei NCTC 13178]